MIQETITTILVNWDTILATIGAVLITATTIARLTPTKEDDTFIQKLRSVLEVIGNLGIPDKIKKVTKK